MRTMQKSIMAMVIATFICWAGGQGLKGAAEFLESYYRTDSITCTGAVTAVTVAYTNDTGSKMAIASIFAMSPVATNNWKILVINNNQTNILVAATALDYTAGTTSIKYDGTGNVPLGAGGIIQITGDLKTNAAARVPFQIHFK